MHIIAHGAPKVTHLIARNVSERLDNKKKAWPS